MISIEFMLLFCISLAAVSLLAGQVLSYGEAVKERISGVSLSASAESSARAAESAYRSGITLKMRQEFRIEEVLVVDSGDRAIEAGGVFEHDESEPL